MTRVSALIQYACSRFFYLIGLVAGIGGSISSAIDALGADNRALRDALVNSALYAFAFALLICCLWAQEELGPLSGKYGSHHEPR